MKEKITTNKCKMKAKTLSRELKFDFIFLFLVFIGMFLSFSMYAGDCGNDQILEERISINKDKASLKVILSEIGEKTNVKFTYSSNKIGVDQVIKVQAVNSKLGNLLYSMLDPLDINYKVYKGRTIVLTKKRKSVPLLANSQINTPPKFNRSEPRDIDILRLTINNSVLVNGVVKDESGEVLIGATVIEKGTSNGTTTDFNGEFSLEVADDAILVVTYIGYTKREFKLDGQSDVEIILTENTSTLNEVVVVGYGRQVKRNITGSVATLSAEQIQDIPVTSFENAIQGQMAGVQVTEPSGEPGAAPSIRIRGLGSISAGNDPLYVVDGFPIAKNVDLGVQGDNFRRGSGRFRPPSQNPLGTLNPSDIESIQVLKDASSAAIYGSRGSNGVILITTKSGKRNGKPILSYDAYVGSQSVANKIELMNAQELIEYNTEATNNAYLQANPGASANDPNSMRSNAAWRLADDVQNPDGTNTDWQDQIFQSAFMQNHNLSATGGSENIGYYVAGNFFSQDGIIEGTNFDRYSFRLNLNVDLTDRFRLGMYLSPSYTSSDKKPAGSPYFARPPGIVYSALVHSPTVRPLNDDGTPNQKDNQSYMLTSDGETSSFSSASNPLAIIQGVDDRLTQFRTLANFFAEYDIVENLTFKTYLGADINNYKRNFYRKNSLLYREQPTGESYGQSSSSESFNWLAEQTLSYNRSFDNIHNLSALVGYTAQKENVDVNTVIADNFPDDLVPTVSGGQVTQGTAATESWSLVSALARVNYDYDDLVLLTGTIRSDRSSRFGPNNKTGIFPSVSVGYRVSKHLSNVDWLSDLKFRFSWGKTGNFLIPNYASVGLLDQSNYVFGNVLTNGISPITISNQDLSWEKTSSIDFGLDFGFLDDRIYGAIEYFKSTTSDLLLAVQIPAALGFTNALTNIGEVVNDGFEIGITSRNLVGEFKWNTDLNFSMVDNEVTKLGPSGDPILSSGGAGNRHITRIGDPIGSYYGYVTDGIFQNQAEINSAPEDKIATPHPGDFRWKDINGDNIIDANDRTVIGNYLPDFTYGITNTFSYKNFGFSFLIQGVEGSEVLNLTRRHLGNGEANFNSYRDWVDRWRSPENPGNGEIPRANRQTGNSNNRPSSFQVEDASYWRLRNMSLSYSLPSTAFKSTFSELRFYLSGTNLFTSTKYIGYNPEVNNIEDNVNVQGEDYGAYPLSRVFSFGVNASF